MEDVTDDANDVNDDAHDDSYDDIEDDDDVDDDDDADDDDESASPENETANSEISTLGITDRSASHRDDIFIETSQCDGICDVSEKPMQKDIHVFDATEMINNNCIVQSTENYSSNLLDNLTNECDAELLKYEQDSITRDESSQSVAEDNEDSPVEQDNDNDDANDSDNYNSISPQCDASSDEPLTSDNSTSEDSKSDDDVTFSDAMLKDQSVSIDVTKQSESESESSQPRFEPVSPSPRDEEAEGSPRFLIPSKSGSDPKRPMARTRNSDSFSVASHLPPLTNRRFSQEKNKESR